VTRKERNQRREKHFIEEDIFHCYWERSRMKQTRRMEIYGTRHGVASKQKTSTHRIQFESNQSKIANVKARDALVLFSRSLRPPSISDAPSKSLDCNHYSYQNRQYTKDLGGDTGPILLAREEHVSWTNGFPICRLEESASTPSFTKCQFTAVWNT
jgi:hypothetical protein